MIRRTSRSFVLILLSLFNLRCGQATNNRPDEPITESKGTTGDQHTPERPHLTLDYLQGRWEYRVDGKLGFGWVFVGDKIVALGKHATGDSLTARIDGANIFVLLPGLAPIDKPRWHPLAQARVIAQDTLAVGAIEEMKLVRVK